MKRAFFIIFFLLSFSLKTFSKVLGTVIVNSNETNSFAYINDKFVGLTPLTVSCLSNESSLRIISSLSDQEFKRVLPSCEQMENFKVDKYINIHFDQEKFDNEKTNFLISNNVFEKKQNSVDKRVDRSIASDKKLHMTKIGQVKFERVNKSSFSNSQTSDSNKLGKGYYLQFLAMPFSENMIVKTKKVLRKYRRPSSLENYAYCVKKIKNDKWIRYTVGPYQNIDDAKDLLKSYPKDSFIEYRNGCD